MPDLKSEKLGSTIRNITESKNQKDTNRIHQDNKACEQYVENSMPRKLKKMRWPRANFWEALSFEETNECRGQQAPAASGFVGYW